MRLIRIVNYFFKTLPVGTELFYLVRRDLKMQSQSFRSALQHQNESSSQTPRFAALASLKFLRAEDRGLGTSRFVIHRENSGFTVNSLDRLNLPMSSQLQLFPVIPDCGGWRQGQIRDKNLSRNGGNATPLTVVSCGILFTFACAFNRKSANKNKPLPRTAKKRKRASSEKGLPADEDLRNLAREYLAVQRSLWSELAAIIPLPTTEVIDQMVDDFKSRHRGRKIHGHELSEIRKLVRNLGGSYSRYSCDNSSVFSIQDQLINTLRKGHIEKKFIPWPYVFADYSVSGRTAARQGYTSYKAVLQDPSHYIQVTFIDDFSRASRDEIEWWRLAHTSKNLGKGMIGASDGFNLSNPDSDVMITIYGLVSRLLLKSIAQKVFRGMAGQAGRGGVLGKLPLGFTKRVAVSNEGFDILGQDGNPTYEPCIDEKTATIRLRIFQLFVEENISAYSIARMFNKEKVENWDGWTEAGIKKLLKSRTAMGIFIWNQFRNQYNLETETWVKVKNPRNEWKVFRDESLRIVPNDLWVAAQRIIAKGKRRNGKSIRSRNQIRATTLFSGTLFCGYCQDRELTLNRSAGKYKVMHCFNGPNHVHGCQLSTTKSTRIIEKCLLDFILNRLITPDALTELLEKSNAFLKAEALKPRVDLGPKHSEVKRLNSKIQKLVKQIEDEADAEVRSVFHGRIRELNSDLSKIKREIKEAQAHSQAPPPPLDKKRLLQYLKDVPELLRGDIPKAAASIRALTGKITIQQESYTNGKRGARWIARFKPDFVRFLSHILPASDYPDSITLEFLNSRIWITPSHVECVLEEVTKHEKFGEKFMELEAKGVSIPNIGAAHGMCAQRVKEILHYAKTGKRPQWNFKSSSAGRGMLKQVFKDIAPTVARMRDKQKLSFPKIATELNFSRSTIRSAYDYFHFESVKKSVDVGKNPTRGHCRTRIAKATYSKIRDLITSTKLSDKKIAIQVGVGIGVVENQRKKAR